MDVNLFRRAMADQGADGFTGAVLIRQAGNVIVEQAFGQANRSEGIPNSLATRFGIASGAKLFTAIAINQLIDAGLLALDARLLDCLPYGLPHFDPCVTIHHLLTHTAGVPDYFDEDVMDDFESLWVDRPMYRIRRLEDFLPLFQDRPMQSGVGERFHYNNAGYILLGLVVEQVTGQLFSDYVTEHVLGRARMTDSGYFEMDALPPRTAQGYIDSPDGRWRTNIYSIPPKGGADGGVYVTVKDMAAAWEALLAHRLLSPASTARLLTPHVDADEENWYYGYGVWIDQRDGEIFKYYLMGYDPGANFHSAVFPCLETMVVVCSNQTDGAFGMMKAIEDELTRALS
ncbi:MAG: beta-lactamase family protein [Firmicutes bacterium]|nr:beta-lactamase family protein [Bacillota bacterium]